jgi:predicted nucleic acid-binding protein
LKPANRLIVVADTSPLLYLGLIGELKLLPSLYREILIPEAVHLEMSHVGAPESLRTLAASTPDWLHIRAALEDLTLPMDLGPGERAALNLAFHLGADRILLDDLGGRRAAEALRLNITGTLGILLEGSRKDFCDLEDALSKLMVTNFYAAPEVLIRIRAAAKGQRE